jgi:hypothetical protein
MRKYLSLLLVIATVFIGISVADTMTDFRYTNVNFTPSDTMGTEDTTDDLLLPAVLGELLPDSDANGAFEVNYVTRRNGMVASTNPGQLYGVITINNTTATDFSITDTFGTQFNVNPAKICGGIDILRVDADGYATMITGTTQVISGIVDNNSNTISLEIALNEPLGEEEKIMIYVKFKTALKGAEPDMATFTNEVSVNGEMPSASIEFS